MLSTFGSPQLPRAGLAEPARATPGPVDTGVGGEPAPQCRGRGSTSRALGAWKPGCARDPVRGLVGMCAEITCRGAIVLLEQT